MAKKAPTALALHLRQLAAEDQQKMELDNMPDETKPTDSLDALTDDTILDILNSEEATDMTEENKSDDLLADAAPVKATKVKGKKPSKKAEEPAQEGTTEALGAVSEAVDGLVAIPEPVKQKPTLEGAELVEGADVEVITKATEEVTDAISKIGSKDSDLLDSYLALGKYAASISPMFNGPKQYGMYLAKKVPESAKLDAALRSNCKWLWQALNDPEHEGSDILVVLGGINDIASFKSANPTVIKREYQKAKKAKDAQKALKDDGIDVEDAEEALATVSKAAKEAANAELVAKLTAMAERMEKVINASLSKTKPEMAAISIDVMGNFRDVIGELLIGTRKEAVEMMEVFARP